MEVARENGNGVWIGFFTFCPGMDGVLDGIWMGFCSGIWVSPGTFRPGRTFLTGILDDHKP